MYNLSNKSISMKLNRHFLMINFLLLVDLIQAFDYNTPDPFDKILYPEMVIPPTIIEEKSFTQVRASKRVLPVAAIDLPESSISKKTVKRHKNDSVLSAGPAAHASKLSIPDRRFVCDWGECKATFKLMKYLRVHQAIHNGRRKFICPELGCDKRFKLKYSLDRHLARHCDDRPFFCNHMGCTASFKIFSDLTIHKKIHLDGNFLCNFYGCQKTFKTKSYLHSHFKRCHADKR